MLLVVMTDCSIVVVNNYYLGGDGRSSARGRGRGGARGGRGGARGREVCILTALSMACADVL